MSHDACPDPFALAALFAMPTDDPRRQHLQRCARCAELEALARLSKGLPSTVPPVARREALRSALLARSVPVPAPRRWPLALAAGLLLFFGAGLWLRAEAPPEAHKDATPLPRGELIAQEGASFLRWPLPGGGEQISLATGTIQLRVEPGAGSPMRVQVGPAEITLSSAQVTIAAYQGELRALDVHAGTISLRLVEGVQELKAGETWPPTPKSQESTLTPSTLPSATPAPLAPAAPPPPRPVPPAPTTLPQAPKETSSPGELALQAGADALRVGDLALAAEQFDQATRSLSDPALIEEAAFLRCAALQRAGRTQDATEALRSFVAAYPASARRGQAQIALATLLARQGQREEAETLFRAAQDDPSPSVREKARAGLDALAPTSPAGK